MKMYETFWWQSWFIHLMWGNGKERGIKHAFQSFWGDFEPTWCMVMPFVEIGKPVVHLHIGVWFVIEISTWFWLCRA